MSEEKEKIENEMLEIKRQILQLEFQHKKDKIEFEKESNQRFTRIEALQAEAQESRTAMQESQTEMQESLTEMQESQTYMQKHLTHITKVIRVLVDDNEFRKEQIEEAGKILSKKS